MSAIISPCGKYRYFLERRLSDLPGVVTFVMLNPSTADAEIDDPTIRRCKAFAGLWGFGTLRVVNLFAYRATNPKELETALNPTGPANMDYVVGATDSASMVICAWGTKGNLFRTADNVVDQLRQRGIEMYALEITKDGFPKHPLYVSSEKKPIRYK